MPELKPSQRAAGSWSPAEHVPPHRHYQPDLLGGRCEVCGVPLPAALPDRAHATCADEWPALVAQSKRATRRQPQPKEQP